MRSPTSNTNGPKSHMSQVARARNGRREVARGAEPDAGNRKHAAAASAETAAPKTDSCSAPTPTQAPEAAKSSHHRGPILRGTGHL